MSESLFAIVIDLAEEPGNFAAERFRRFVTENPEVPHWWNHFPSLFIIETGLSSASIAEQVKASLGDVSFLLMRVDPSNIDGWLPEQAGHWLEQRMPASRGVSQAAE